jgi:hypothetical protein
MNPAVAIFVGLFMICALVPVVTSAFFGYRAGERLAICVGAISGLVLLTSCGFLFWLPHVSELSGEDNRLAMAASVFTGVPALCTFLGNISGYIAMGFLHEKE